MKKYLTVFQQSLSTFTAYRLEIFLQILQSFIPPAIMIAALSFSVPTSQIRISQLIPYYVLNSLVYPLIRSNIDEEIDELTQSGEINSFLLKPLALFKWLYAKNISEKIVIFITLAPVFILFLVLNNLTPYKLILLMISLLIAFTLSFTLSYFVGLFCFWIDEFWSVHNVKHVTIQLLGGIVLPYTFFPESVALALRWSPFPYLASWPVSIIQGRMDPADLLAAGAWVLILLSLVNVLQKKAILKYSFTAS